MEAHVRPFFLKADHDKWRTRGNRLPPRRMDNTRETELRRQIEKKNLGGFSFFSLANGGLAGSPPTLDVWVEN